MPARRRLGNTLKHQPPIPSSSLIVRLSRLILFLPSVWFRDVAGWQGIPSATRHSLNRLGKQRRFRAPYQPQFRQSMTKSSMSADSNSVGNSAADEDAFRLGYVTDVEGNLEYFCRFVHESKVLTWSQHQRLIETNLSLTESMAPTTSIRMPPLDSKEFCLDLQGQNSYFVYGGDAVDKGVGDIRMVRALVDLKRRYPDRVYLLVGNRDLNKLRLTAELSLDDMDRPISSIPPPHWDLKAPTLEEFLKPKEGKEKANTRVNRLHYMLQHTLGCPNTFEFRREEVAILTDQPISMISDEQVVDNFLREVEDPDGSLHQYYAAANIAICVGNTLFCHGAVDAATMKFVPSSETRFENPTTKPPPAAMIDNVQEWTHALNKYLEEGLNDFRRRPYWNKDRTSRGGEALMALQNRPAMWGRSIISNCYGDGGCITTDTATEIRNDRYRKELEKTNPLAFEKVSSDPMDEEVAEWLRKDGIQRVVVGHKPTGDCPAVLSAAYTGVEIVSADTSFSDTSSKDNRGKALSVVEIAGASQDDNHLEISGFLKSGASYTTRFPRLSLQGIDPALSDPLLGTRILGQDWWVKAIVDEKYYLARGSGRKVEHKMSTPSVFAGGSTPIPQ